jgi:DNA-binding NarL/FixJ family response regulator
MTRVLMISRQSMFEQGLDALLRQEPALEIVVCETDVGRAMERIKELRPDVVIFEANGPEADVGQVVRRLLRENLKLKVIELNLRDNTVCIYCGEHRVIKQVADLVEAIKV